TVGGVGIAARLDRLERRDGDPAPTQRGQYPRGNKGLSDTGIGARDEVRPHVSERMLAATPATRWRISSRVIDSRGMSTTTGPSGRRRSWWARAARQTLAPMAAS